MDVNKCNISKYALELYNSMKWGIKCNSGVNRGILENYIGYLACPSIDLIVCSPDNCSNPTIISACVLDILTVTVNRVDNNSTDNNVDIIFSLQIGDYTGGTLPFIYAWSFEGTYVDIIGSTTNQELNLKLRPNANLDFIIFSVTISIIDANGCADSKRVYYTPAGIIIDPAYIPCVNIGTLLVT